jgi:Arc/MetJ-type ribon-helix-helix transcriptional regulator
VSKRKNIYLDAATAGRLTALAAVYHSDSEAIRVAVQRLYEAEFQPTSAAPDAVMERLRLHLTQALGTVNGELERRSDIESE